MDRIVYTAEDFKWTQWDGSAMATALDEAVAEAKRVRVAIVAVADDSRTFENTFAALDRMYIPLNQISSRVSFLMAVSPVAEIRSAAQKVADDLDAAILHFSFDEDLFHACNAAAQIHEELPAHAVKFRDETMRDYRRLGFGLSAAKRAELQENKKQIQTLCNQFDKNLNDSKKQILIAPNEIAGLSSVYLAGLVA
jgi:Zn-dependent oligopeptidase